MTRDEITTLIADIEAVKARLAAMPRDFSTVFPPWGGDSAEQTALWEADGHPKLMRLIDYIRERSGDDMNYLDVPAILKRAAIYAAS